MVIKNSSILYFNSIKVQLKPLRSLTTLTSQKFQFHKGTIKTLLLRLKNLAIRYFNSIKVQLKRKRPTLTTNFYKYFNSIKVQLKL